MAMSPAELRRRRLNMLMSMSYAAMSSAKVNGALALLGSEATAFALDFATNTYASRIVGTVGTVTGTATNFITFSRSSIGTRINPYGQIETLASNVPRLDYDPVTLYPKGLLIEEARTNLVLNSDTLSTQSVTVANVAHTLSFYGTGTVTLSGVSTAGPLVGTGAFPTRVTLTFTPLAGSLTLTVTGSVRFAQLEAGSFATSYIPTTSASVARSAEIATIPVSAIPYGANEGTAVAAYVPGNLSASVYTVLFDDIDTAQYVNIMNMMQGSSGTPGSGWRASVRNTNVSDVSFDIATPALSVGSTYKLAFAYKLNDFAASFGGGTVQTDTLGTPPPGVDLIRFGSHRDGVYMNGCIRQFSYFPRRLTNAELQTKST